MTDGGVETGEHARVPLCCPRCSGTLETDSDFFRCVACHAEYPIVLGIADFRVFPDPYIDYTDDRAKGARVLEGMQGASFAALVRRYWQLTPNVPHDLVQGYVGHVLAAAERGRSILEEARRAATRLNTSPAVRNRALLEIGCGTGGLLIAAAREYEQVVGVDIAFRWLAIATRRVEEAVSTGELTPQQASRIQLLCACAERLPLPEASFDLIVGASVLEHATRQEDVLRQARRALRDEGMLFLTTVNRLSLAPEPHVRVWGVGFLPRRWMAAYVRRVRGVAYRHIRLLSAKDVVALLRRSGFAHWEVQPPRLAPADLRRYPSVVRAAAHVYAGLREVPGTRQLLTLFGPLLQVAAVSDSEAQPALNRRLTARAGTRT
ncbi:MAG TPA: class I SAM-dependent methyltransferase [Chloroflexota bacterium]